MKFPISSDKFTLVVCEFVPCYFCEHMYEFVPFDEPESIKRAVHKKRAEFFVGRFIVSKILNNLGSKSVVVPIGTHRNPMWPKDYLGSITHSEQTVMVAVGLTTDLNLLDIDCEHIMEHDTAHKVASQIASEQEIACFTHLGIPYETSITLAFSTIKKLCLKQYILQFKSM